MEQVPWLAFGLKPDLPSLLVAHLPLPCIPQVDALGLAGTEFYQSTGVVCPLPLCASLLVVTLCWAEQLARCARVALHLSDAGLQVSAVSPWGLPKVLWRNFSLRQPSC